MVMGKIQKTLQYYIEIFILLYADDTVIFSETKEVMQKALDLFTNYCELWTLSVNIEKPKVIIFSKRK